MKVILTYFCNGQRRYGYGGTETWRWKQGIITLQEYRTRADRIADIILGLLYCYPSAHVCCLTISAVIFIFSLAPAEPLGGAHGTLRFRGGTPVDNDWCAVCWLLCYLLLIVLVWFKINGLTNRWISFHIFQPCDLFSHFPTPHINSVAPSIQTSLILYKGATGEAYEIDAWTCCAVMASGRAGASAGHQHGEYQHIGMLSWYVRREAWRHHGDHHARVRTDLVQSFSRSQASLNIRLKRRELSIADMETQLRVIAFLAVIGKED